jgi:hypothetical protein
MTAPKSPLSAALLASLLLLGATTASAQGLDGRRLGLAVGSSDYGTSIKAQWGDRLDLSLGRTDWRWEAQAVSFGRGDYDQFGNTYRRSAWSIGASALPLLPLERGLVGHGKVGLHYVHSQASGPGLNARRNGLKLGVGAGVMWRALPSLGIKFEYEVIGGTSGDVISIGAEMPW